MLQNSKRSKSMTRRTMARRVMCLIAIAGGVSLAGCSADERHQYLGHSDKIYNTTGEATNANIISQTVDPWSPHSLEAETKTDGQRAKAAIDRYQKDQVRQPASPSTR